MVSVGWGSWRNIPVCFASNGLMQESESIVFVIDDDPLDRESTERLVRSVGEREVFKCVVSGMLNKQIADELGTTERTIKFHRGQIMRKMEVKSLAELVRIADALGIAGQA